MGGLLFGFRGEQLAQGLDEHFPTLIAQKVDVAALLFNADDIFFQSGVRINLRLANKFGGCDLMFSIDVPPVNRRSARFPCRRKSRRLCFFL